MISSLVGSKGVDSQCDAANARDYERQRRLAWFAEGSGEPQQNCSNEHEDGSEQIHFDWLPSPLASLKRRQCASRRALRTTQDHRARPP